MTSYTNNYGMNDEQFIALFNHFAKLIRMLPTTTETQKKRKENAERHLLNADNDCGAFGRIREILNTIDDNKKKTNFSKQNKTDNYVYLRKNGKRRLHSVEIKSNMGRMTEFFNTDSTVKAKYLNDYYIVYEIDLCNATTNYKERKSGQRILPLLDFITYLIDFNALKIVTGKAHKDKIEYQVQASSKKLFNAICDYPIYRKGMTIDI